MHAHIAFSQQVACNDSAFHSNHSLLWGLCVSAYSREGGGGAPQFRGRRGPSCAASTEHSNFHKGQRSITKMLTCPMPKTAAP